MFANTYLHNNIIHTYYLLHVTVIFLNRVRRHRRAAPPNVRRGDIKAKSATTSDFCRQRRMTPQLRPQLPPPAAAWRHHRFRSVSSVGRSAAVTCRCAPPPLPPSTACRPSFPHYAVVGGIVRVASYSSHHILDPPCLLSLSLLFCRCQKSCQ